MNADKSAMIRCAEASEQADTPTALGRRMRLQPASVHRDGNESLVLPVARDHLRSGDGTDTADAESMYVVKPKETNEPVLQERLLAG